MSPEKRAWIRHGCSYYKIIEYLADTVNLLRFVQVSDLSDVRRALEVVKMRMSAHSCEIKPFELMQDKMLVYSEANAF